MATIKPRRGTSTPTTGTIIQNELAVDTTNKRIYIGAADGSGTLIGSAPAGSDTQIQFNDSGNLGADAGLTYNKTTDSLTITGDLAVNGGDITTSSASATIFNTTATSLNIGGVASAMTIGDATSCTITSRGGTLVGNTTTQNLFNTVATTMNFGGAATTLTIGATTGTAAIRNPAIKLGNTTASISTNTGSANNLTIAPYGDIILSPNSTTVVGGDFPQITINNADNSAGTIDFTGGDLYLGTKTDGVDVTTSVNIIFEGSSADGFETTLTVENPTTADRTITLPNNTGTVALVAGSDTQVIFNDGGSALGGDSGLTYNKSTDSLTVAGDIAVNGGDITSTATTFNALNSTVTTLNLGGAATAIAIGASTGTTTFNHSVVMSDKTLSRVEMLDYFERSSIVSIAKGGGLTLDLATAQVFSVTLNAAISSITISNIPDNASSNACGFTIIFIADGTVRSITWPGSVKWPGGTAPTMTGTNNKKDIISFLTDDSGTTWYGFVGGQNF